MNISKPLPVALFVYEVLRLLALAAFMFMVSAVDGGDTALGGVFFPHIVYISSSALFPLMTLFIWLKPDEYRSYLTLYVAGKTIAVVSFFVWMIFFPRGDLAIVAVMSNMAILGASILINMADALSVWGAWTLKNKYRRAESGGF